MSRLIDADKLKEHYSWWHDMEDFYTNNSLQQEAEDLDTIIDVQPTVDPVKHGRWETEIKTNRDGTKSCLYACSLCGKFSLNEFLYCPNCGAKMDGENDEID